MTTTSPTGTSLSARLDHVGLIGRDLEATAQAWQHMGFQLSPLSRQRGRMPGRDELGPWATANRCALFAEGYVELIGVVDAACFNPWESFLDRFEGMHILAMRIDSADDAWAQIDRIPALANRFSPPVQRERVLDVDGVPSTMRFRNVFSRDEHCPEGRIIVIEHQTPQFLWQPKYLQHPNGAVALQAMYLCCDLKDHEQSTHPCARIAALTGARQVAASGDQLLLRDDSGHDYHVLSPSAFERQFGAAAPAVPAFVGAAVQFTDRTRAAALMRSNGLPVTQNGDEWYVRAAANPDFVLVLTEQGQPTRA